MFDLNSSQFLRIYLYVTYTINKCAYMKQNSLLISHLINGGNYVLYLIRVTKKVRGLLFERKNRKGSNAAMLSVLLIYMILSHYRLYRFYEFSLTLSKKKKTPKKCFSYRFLKIRNTSSMTNETTRDVTYNRKTRNFDHQDCSHRSLSLSPFF